MPSRDTCQSTGLRVWTATLTATVFLILPAWALVSEGPAEALWLLIPYGSVGGGIALAITCIVRARSKRIMVEGDVIRIVCWTLFGYAFGSSVNGYFYVLFPDYANFADGAQSMIMLVALLTIFLSMFAWPPGPKAKPGCCASCGYLLRELTIARCPECGAPFDSRLLETRGDVKE